MFKLQTGYKSVYFHKKGIIIVVLKVKRTILNYVKRIKYIVVSGFLHNILVEYHQLSKYLLFDKNE